jgi:hypothetical protein
MRGRDAVLVSGRALAPATAYAPRRDTRPASVARLPLTSTDGSVRDPSAEFSRERLIADNLRNRLRYGLNILRVDQHHDGEADCV